ncbi:hypothetical protein Leryth_019627 [Lithospermum erythrorhizon]|nr:hypothetical protein Leryth_019627 [Lithospermum erythrorhizon]
MVVATTPSIRSEKIRHIELPIIDLKAERSQVVKEIVKASEEFGFFKVINHPISNDVISRIEQEGLEFFAKPLCVKQQAGPANPYGYGSKYIGMHGDKGEVEYILLHTNPLCISEKSQTISSEPIKFGCAVSTYIKEVRELACDILELMEEGLGVPLDTSALSKLIRDVESDSLLRLNHYPPLKDTNKDTSPSSIHHQIQNSCSSNSSNNNRVIGFGEHTDPQIVTLLKSNDVGGLQISLEDGVWVPVCPQPPSSFCVFVGDILQAMTNGRFPSVRHRAIVNTSDARMSMAYFATPPLTAKISPIPELVTGDNKKLYRPFTWAEYKKTTYALRLSETRLRLFLVEKDA